MGSISSRGSSRRSSVDNSDSGSFEHMHASGGRHRTTGSGKRCYTTCVHVLHLLSREHPMNTCLLIADCPPTKSKQQRRHEVVLPCTPARQLEERQLQQNPRMPSVTVIHFLCPCCSSSLIVAPSLPPSLPPSPLPPSLPLSLPPMNC